MYNTLNCTSNTLRNMTEEDDGILRQDEMLYNDQDDRFFDKMRGASKEPARETDPETTTVATSAVYAQIEEVASSVPTAFYT
jgi:hypothetical protein